MRMDETARTRDALVIGGGPAGLSAAIALGRACRSVAVFDRERPGRCDRPQINHNYLGFPEGIAAADLVALGQKQAARYGAELIDREVVRLQRDGNRFLAETDDGALAAGWGVILATGVSDRWPRFPGYEQFIGVTMHWCIVCDGYEMQGQRVVLVGNDAETAETAMQMQRYTPDVAIVANAGALGMDAATTARLERCGIPLHVDRIAGATARAPGRFATLELERGGSLPLDHLFSEQGADPNTALARALGVATNDAGYIIVDTEGRTSLPRVYAAGDVTRLFAHQLATAVHEGATAASSLRYDLWQAEQRAAEQVARAGG
jgi:thioredoxin reductase (NADPH)